MECFGLKSGVAVPFPSGRENPQNPPESAGDAVHWMETSPRATEPKPTLACEGVAAAVGEIVVGGTDKVLVIYIPENFLPEMRVKVNPNYMPVACFFLSF